MVPYSNVLKNIIIRLERQGLAFYALICYDVVDIVGDGLNVGLIGRRLMSNRKGSTLAEVAVVVAILGVLAALLIPSMMATWRVASSVINPVNILVPPGQKMVSAGWNYREGLALFHRPMREGEQSEVFTYEVHDIDGRVVQRFIIKEQSLK